MRSRLRTRETAEEGRLKEDWGSLMWLVGQALGNSKEMTFGRVVIKRGKSNPRHRHRNCEEILYLLKGRLEHSIGGEKVALRAGDVLVVPAGVMHNAVNIGHGDADMIVAYSSGVREFELETT